MKFTTLAAAAAIALAGNADAWRVYLHDHSNFGGTTYTASGPGNPGSACHIIPKEHRYRAASITYYAYDRQTNPTTRCTLELFEGFHCDGMSGPEFSSDTKTALHSAWRDRASCFKTTCNRV
ncbi:hypothetical protein C8A00DRAFT_30555 [Chaetomidium leptoderma]|uniref:Uncharacterized protein n=1 Tax=Chaetomidium leptoderma TaxID=669021 RepID=A0AAN6VSN0_9PEZI|nr:hypothetical protein C8A00DRAFT_30555 [Chaetomidium leptoderma]